MPWRIALVCLVALWPATTGHAGTTIDFGRNHALVIGINDYRDLPDLAGPVKDASAVAELLGERYGFETTLLFDPSRAEVIDALNQARSELAENDNLLIYYAGYSVRDEQTDTCYWLPSDADEESEANWIAAPTVTRNLQAMAARHAIVITDACYSGVLARGGRSGEIERLATKRSRTALVSGWLEPVLADGGDGHSVFASALLNALRENHEILDGQGLFAAVREATEVELGGGTMYFDIRSSGHEGGDFVFVPLDSALTSAPSEKKKLSK